MFSPKVLDRANTIEFRLTNTEMEKFLKNIKEVNIEVLKGEGAKMANSFFGDGFK
jgi:5-methylcytosine-specific restriction protein B